MIRSGSLRVETRRPGSVLGVIVLALAVAFAAAAEESGAPRAAPGPQASEASEPARDVPASDPAPAAGTTEILYKLRIGKPRDRIGGGRRGAEDPLPQLMALVPNHVGLTTSPQPALYWSVSGPAPDGTYFAFAITDEESIDPLVEERLAAPTSAGIQEILLAERDARLDTGVEYRWSVTLVVDPNGPSTRDPVVGGWVARVPPPADLEARLRDAGPEAAPAIYADEGLWYDALAPLASRALRDPGDATTRRHLAGLLRQVDLEGVASEVAPPGSSGERD